MSDPQLKKYYLAALGFTDWQQHAMTAKRSLQSLQKITYIPAILKPDHGHKTNSQKVLVDIQETNSKSMTDPERHQGENTNTSGDVAQAATINKTESGPEFISHLSYQQKSLNEFKKTQIISSPVKEENSVEYMTDKDVSTSDDPIDLLNKKIKHCSQCSKRLNEENAVTGRWLYQSTVKAKTLFLLLESPQSLDFQKGKLLSGSYFQLVLSLLKAFNFDQHNVYLGSVMRCYSHELLEPEKEELEHCVAYLKQEIELLKPDLLISLGKTSLHYLSSDIEQDASLSEIRQKIYTLDKMDSSFEAIATFHPAFLCRNPLFKQQAFEDWLLISSRLESRENA